MKKTKTDHYTEKEALEFHTYKKPGKIEKADGKNAGNRFPADPAGFPADPHRIPRIPRRIPRFPRRISRPGAPGRPGGVKGKFSDFRVSFYT